MNFMTKMLNSSDKSVEFHIVLSIITTLGFVGLAIYTVVFLGHAFDPSAYGQGAVFVLGGSGAAALGQGLQRKAEGSQDSSNNQ